MSWEDDERGCTCPTGHPPCGFCTSLTEEEVAIYDEYGSGAVYQLRKGVTPPAMAVKLHYACMEEYGEF